MIVDDDVGRRKRVYDVLKITGFDIFSAASGDEALGRLPREKPRLVVVNTTSPGTMGNDFIRRLRTYGMGQKMIVIGMTTDEDGEKEKARQAGADELLSELFSPFSLVEMVSNHLGIERIEIPKGEFEKRREVVEELAQSYRQHKHSHKDQPPKVQLMLPGGRDLGTLLLTEDAGRGRT